MKLNQVNICPSCIYKDTCVLTMQKNKVWSCSEYEEGSEIFKTESTPVVKKQTEPEMAMA
ncbi:hypothetical protein ULMS_18070 [Patiriisocius marinistellae]|uniref:Uncharacterized protein n=1 Tax=Patiriisocius marinistellae TaxID=2494560 RepID=A0A5J4G135_9FLAO|nr:hypothetical protein [Patiriisocius marinistellae]GEQ86299.1 hypothetical protein ULMS_18070 [Patiriisocius marinistellae]